MGTRVIRVETTDRLLRRALLAQLKHAPELQVQAENHQNGHRPEVVVSTTSECPVSKVIELVKDGARVVVLAPVPRDEEQRKYKTAGVSAYLPMTANGESLIREIREAVS